MIRRLDIGEHQSQICAGLLLATSTIKTVLNAENLKYTRNWLIWDVNTLTWSFISFYMVFVYYVPTYFM